MGVKSKRVVKLIVFFIAFFAIGAFATKILKEKFYFSIKINSPETEVWQEFYDLEKNSIDVLFMGSSHVYNGINPVVFYEETGMRGFDFASSNQDLYMTYVYLQEALKYQKPEYVVLDGAMFNRGVFASQKYYEMSFDSMKWSKLKYDSLMEWKHMDPEQRIIDRFIPLLAYHSRWEELKFFDFSQKNLTTAINGYIPSKYTTMVMKYEYDEYDPLWEIPTLTRSYFEKISNLCFENDIELVLILIPDTTTRYGITEPVKMLAWDYDLTCIDYNETEKFEETGVDTSCDFKDVGHLNSFGAEKFTKALAQDLKMYAGMYGKGNAALDDPEWQTLMKQWEEVHTKQYLTRVTDLGEYLDILAESDYTVLAAISDEGTAALTPELCEKLNRLGFDVDFSQGYCKSFYGVVDGDSVICQMESTVLEAEGRFDNGKFWEIYSGSFVTANAEGKACGAEIKISGIDYCMNGRGINFVIYDKERDEVLDSVYFDTFDASLYAGR